MAYGESTHKEGTIKVPVTLFRGWQRGSKWTATVRHQDHRMATGWFADGKTEAEAKDNLTQVVRRGLDLAEQHPIIVIGGSADYTDCIHLIMADTHGIGVRIARSGRSVGSWWADAKTVEDELQHVLDHVGGEPQVVRL